MKHKVANYKPSCVYLENQRFDTFVLNFTEVRGDAIHRVRMHFDTDFIRLLAYRLGDQLKYIDKELEHIKTSLRNAGGGQ